MGINEVIDFFRTKEDLTHIKLKLIKIAALLNEDENYSKGEAYNDLLKAIKLIEDVDVPIKHILED